MKFKVNFKKILSVIATAALLFNSLAPSMTVLAQEVTPAPDPTPVDTVAPTETPTDTPAATATPDVQTYLTPEVSPEATDLVTPTPVDQPVVTQAPESNPTTTSPPQVSNSVESTSVPSVSPSATPSTPTKHGTLTETTIDNIDLSGVNTLNSNVDGGTITTDKPDYNPTSIVLISGSGFTPNKTYTIEIVSTDQPPVDFQDQTKADNSGNINYAYQLDGTMRPNYTVYIKDGAVTVATTSFTDPNPSANLDQCANDPAPSSHSDGCSASASDWVNGNLGASKSVYLEGDTIPYRMRFDNLSLASHTVVIQWDTAQSGKHATDYLTTFNRTVTTANPCLGVSGCSASSTLPIPADSQVTGGGVTPVAGNFTLYGGTITGVSAYSYPDGAGFSGNKTAQLTITFTASVANPVLAWGGHIATRADWGSGNSAIDISGSPYHMRLMDLDGSGGNQDRSLSADAVVFPASITIIKDATPNGSTSFGYTASPAPLSNFNLVDDGTAANYTKVFSNITTFQAYNIVENAASGWTLSFNNPVCTVTSPNGGTQTGNVGTRTLSIDLKEGENVTCTFNNVLQNGTLTVQKTTIPAADPTQFAISATGSGTITGGGAGTISDSTDQVYTVTAGTYSVTETVPAGWSQTGNTCTNVVVAAGGSASCLITNTKLPKLTVHKVVINHGLTNDSSHFAPYKVDNTTVTLDQSNTFSVGNHTVTEANDANYTATFSGACDANGGVTLAAGDDKTCTITNEENLAHLTVTKTVINHGGNATTASFAPYNVDSTGVTLGVSNVFNSGNHTVTEVTNSNYTQTFSGDCNSNGVVTLNPGDNKTCAITNEEKPAHLTLVKTITNNDGGNNAATEWTLNANGPTPISGATGSQNVTGATVNSGTYTLSETNGPSGYIPSNWVCVGGAQDGSSITLASGQSATCTINNDDLPAHITLIKVIQGDQYGDTAGVNDFGLVIGATSVNSGDTLSVDSNTSYSLNEAGLPGYEFVSLTGLGCPASLGDTVTLNENGQITCTITNKAIAPTLTVVKIVDNGETGATYQASDFQMMVDGGNVPQNSPQEETIGSHTVTESGPSGYTSAFSGDCDVNGTVSLALADDKTCTITNTAIAPKLTLVKTVVNDNGGKKEVADFPLFVDGKGVVSGVSSTQTVGEHTTTETSDPGYSASSWGGDCSENGTVTLALGDNKTCTITNDDIAPRLRLIKNVNNNEGGEAVAGDWTLTADGEGGFSDLGNSLTFHDVLAGTTYDLSESQGPAGYSQGLWTCSGREETGGQVTLNLAEEVTCAITNTFVARYNIEITKTNNASGTISAGSSVTYTLNVTNDSNVSLGNLNVYDFLPGGFTYVLGSTTGATTSDPTVSGSKLTWNLGSILAGQTLSISYQTTASSDLSDGTYTNSATCSAINRLEDEKDCNQASSSVTIGSGVNFGGNLVGQVLGASTELPATGSSTLLLIVSLGLLGTGLFLRGFEGKKLKKYAKK